MARLDYLAEVGEPWKRVAVFSLLAATLLSTACLLITIAAVIVIGIPPGLLGPSCGCLVIFTLLTIVCGWIMIRLLRGIRARNGRTTLPEWFIQLFGIVFLMASAPWPSCNANPGCSSKG